jgi:hypothetical protein
MRAPHTLSTFHGSIKPGLEPSSSPVEEWQFSLRSEPSTITDEAALEALATAVRACFVTNLRPIMAPSIFCDKVTVVQVGADGLWKKRSDGSYLKGEVGSPFGGTGASGPVMPAQTALCVSLLTPRSGPRGKGRFYAPWPGSDSLTSARIINGPTLDTWADAFAEFVRDLNLALGTVGVYSTIGNPGVVSPVTAIKLGAAPDTQRSRRGRVPEGYDTVAL